MRIARLPVLVLAIGIALNAGAAAQAPPPQPPQQQQQTQEPPRTGSVRLAADPAWTDTNIDVGQGDQLNLTAVGLPAPPNPALQQTVPDPAGIPGYDNFERPIPEAPFGAVIARIGGGAPFLVGPSWSGPAPAAGRLELGVNIAGAIARRFGPTPLFEAGIEDIPPPVAVLPVDVDPDANALNAVVPAATPAAATPTRTSSAATATDTGPSPPADRTWLIALLVALAIAGILILYLYLRRPTPVRVVDAAPAAPAAAPPPPLIRPSLDTGAGDVAGDAIEAAGPDVRLRATLEPGETLFDGNEPEVGDG